MMSARLFKADEALEMGLVNFVESEGDIHDAAYAERIASNAPPTIRAARAAISDVMLEASKRMARWRSSMLVLIVRTTERVAGPLLKNGRLSLEASSGESDKVETRTPHGFSFSLGIKLGI